MSDPKPHQASAPNELWRVARLGNEALSRGNTAIGLLRRTGWDNIAACLRHHARDPDRAINSLLTC